MGSARVSRTGDSESFRESRTSLVLKIRHQVAKCSESSFRRDADRVAAATYGAAGGDAERVVYSPIPRFADSGVRVHSYGVGRGCGVGRSLGVALGVAVGVGVGVTAGVGVGVTVGVGVGVGVTAGVGVGVGVG